MINIVIIVGFIIGLQRSIYLRITVIRIAHATVDIVQEPVVDWSKRKIIY